MLASLAPVRIEKSIIIARAPEQVWEFIADARNDPRWCEKVVSVEQVAGEGPGPGARYRALHRPRPFKPPVSLAIEVAEFLPPHRLRWREEDADGVFDVAYTLVPAKNGTRLSQLDDIDWKIPALARPVARLMVSRDLARQFAALKQLLEADA